LGIWPFSAGAQVIEAGVSGASGGVAVATAGSEATKGSWIQLIASTADDAQGFLVTFGFGDTGEVGAEMLVDIGIGANPNEVAIVANLPANMATAVDRNVTSSVYIPLRVPAGTRITARAQSTNADTPTYAADTILVSVHMVSRTWAGMPGCGECETLGADTTDSAGTAVDPGATPNTKGAVVVFSASLGEDACAALVGATRSGENRALTTCDWLVDVLVGGAGVEEVVVPNVFFGGSDSGDMISPFVSGPVPCYIPAGSRVTVRASSDLGASPDRILDVILYLFR